MAKSRRKDLVLSPEEVNEGIDKTCKQAYDLAHAAFLTDGQGIRAVARALYILSIEEYGRVGWLYWALSLRQRDTEGWQLLRQALRSPSAHALRNEVGRLMALHLSTNGLLPLLSDFFRFRFPFFGITPTRLDQMKQAMLYVDFDEGTRLFISPTDRYGTPGIDNADFFEEVWRLIRYIAYNHEHHVFDSKVMQAFRHLNYQAQNVQHRAILMRLFYACVLRHPTGMSREKSLGEIVEDLKSEHGMEPDTLVAELIELGDELRGTGEKSA